MAHEITQTFEGRAVTVQQLMSMSFDRVQQMHDEIKKYQIEMNKYQMEMNARNNTHSNISNMHQNNNLSHTNKNNNIPNLTENPIDIILALLNLYPQIETWLKSISYYSTVTTSPTNATECLTSLMQQRPHLIQWINLIEHQLKNRRSIPQIENNNSNNSKSRKRKLQDLDSNNSVKRRKLSNKDNEEKLQCLCDEYRQKNKTLTDCIEIMQTKLDIWECKSEKLNPMNLDELNELKIKMQNKIKLIERAEKKIMDNTYKCLACVDNVKNISFDSCTHMALCDKCEAALEVKRCPICQTPYKNVKKINF
eukprot:551369_1